MDSKNISVKIYYGKEKKIMDSFIIEIGHEISSIDEARLLMINYLDSFYIDVKYKLNITKSYYDHETIISLYFEENISLNRELLLKKILE